MKQVGTVEQFKAPASMLAARAAADAEAAASAAVADRAGASAHFTTGRMAASLTSSAVPIVTRVEVGSKARGRTTPEPVFLRP